MSMTHRKAVAAMLLATLMWSIAGVVTRHLDAARSFEVTFWRALFSAIALAVMLAWMRGPAPLLQALRNGGRKLWVSGLCWMVMFTAYMLALTLTTVANVLVTLALGPLLTALIARLVLGHRLAARTWVAIAVAGIGIAWMYSGELTGSDPRHLLGTAVALCVPIAAAVNWSVLQHNRGADRRRARGLGHAAVCVAAGGIDTRPRLAGHARGVPTRRALPDGGCGGAGAECARGLAAVVAGGDFRCGLGLARRG
jgi:drug/metabolite transporter (DMT)-like permease